MKQISRVVISLVLASLLLGVALGAMAWTGPAVAATPTENGNGGAGVVISPTAQTQTADPNQTITYTHHITNTGSVSDTFQMALSNSGNGFAVGVSSADITLTEVGPKTFTFTLDAAISGSIMLTVHVPLTAIGGMTHTAQVTVTSQTTPTIWATAVNITTVSLYGVELQPDRVGNAAPGKTITYTHSLTNTGNRSDSFDLIYDSSITSTVAFSPTSPIELAAGEQISIAVSITIPADALADTIDTTVITATSQGNPTISATVTNATTVNTVYDVQIEPGGEQAVDPGEPITYIHLITNTGNITDTFTVAVLDSDSAFATSLVYPNPLTPTLSLGPFKTETITLTVGVPLSATGGITHTAQVVVTSQTISTVTATAVNTTTVNYVWDVDLGPERQGTADPGATITYTHMLTNTGNFTDTFNLSHESDEGFDVTITPSEVTLPQGGTAEIQVAITIPTTALAGVYSTVIAATSSPEDNNPARATVTNTTNVNAVYGVQIEPGGAQSANPGGEPAVYTHLITNTGNISDTYTITATSPSFPAALSVVSLTLPPGESDTLIVMVTVPDGAAAGTTDNTTITVSSDNASAVEATNTTTANQVANLSITANPPAAQQAFPGDWVTYTHTIVNLGNGSDTFTFTVANSNPAFIANVIPGSLILAAGDSGVVTVAVQAPAAATAGTSNETTVTAVSTFNSTITRSAINTTTVKTAGVLLGPDQAKTVSPGSSIIYTLALTNTGSLTDTFTLTVTGNVFFTQLSQLTITVPAEETAVISVTITAPRQVVSGTEDVATISATSANRPSARASATLTITVGQHNLFLPVVQIPGEWQRVGTNWPADGRRAYSVAVCPTDNAIVYAGTNDALYRLNSNQWQKVTSGGLPTSGLALSVVLSPDNCNTVYVGFENSGVWRSDDGGTTWNRVGGSSGISRVEKLVVLQGDRLFALSDVEIYYWDNGWLPVTAAGSRFGSEDRPVSNIYAFSPEGPLYAVQWFEGSIWRNPTPLSNPRNGWSLFPNLLQTGDIAMRAVAGDAAGPRLIGTVDNHYARQGNSWARVQPFGARAFALDGPISFAGYTGGKGVYLSYDDRIFTPMNHGWGTPPTTVYTLLINQGDLYAGAINGVWVYRNYP